MFRLLRRGPFALLWAGATVSTTGDAMSWVALVWLVYRQRGQAGDVAVLAAAYTAPVAVGGLLAGGLLDRSDRRRLLAADNLVRGLAFLTVPVAAALGLLTLTHLYLVAACYGLLKMVSLAGFPTLIPAYVDDADLQRANALEGLSFGASQAAGAALAAVLLPLVGAVPLLALDALSYLVYALCLARLPAGGGRGRRGRAALPAGGGAVRLAHPAAAQHHGHVHAVQPRRGRPAGVPARLQRAARHRGGRLRAAGERRHGGRAGRLDRRRSGRRRPPGTAHRGRPAGRGGPAGRAAAAPAAGPDPGAAGRVRGDDHADDRLGADAADAAHPGGAARAAVRAAADGHAGHAAAGGGAGRRHRAPGRGPDGGRHRGRDGRARPAGRPRPGQGRGQTPG